MIDNRGIISHGDNNNFNNNAIGDHARVSVPAFSSSTPTALSEASNSETTAQWDVGVVTILSEELRAVKDELRLERHKKPGGLYFYEGEHIASPSPLRVVATQSQSQGQRSAMAALGNLRRHYNPRFWVLVGVGGGIHDEYARVGNVIVSTDIVYYENRKINPHGDVRRRGEHRQAPAAVVHAVNAFFTEHGNPARIHGRLATHAAEVFEVHPGVIGSGEAVIADGDAEVRRYLKTYHEKVLAVDMEAGGLSQYWQENSVSGESNPGWVVIRGVSDNADENKGHAYHDLAARNAAHVLAQLLTHLC
ncbi:hypothetical protein J7W19_24690 [Streptomyces mobaraensis NBRC 13819 = DSM 40847]|nr:hypothetical protein [Streptomyces mobaraensis]QTT76151.1 hypothetical protein J7W19_24690 [Streptomyces mobaraensis NBRC 13819 = DSM 40847]